MHLQSELVWIFFKDEKRSKWNKTNEAVITYIPALHIGGSKVLWVRPLALHFTGVYKAASIGRKSLISMWWLTLSNHVWDNNVMYVVQVCT